MNTDSGQNRHPSEVSLAARFRNANTALFAFAFIVMALAMAWAFQGLLVHISAEYAKNYAGSAAEVLSSRFGKEINLVARAARSGAVTAWLADENHEGKKAQAFKEMADIIGNLYSFNLYIGVAGSLNQYKAEQIHSQLDLHPFQKLDPTDPLHAWYFMTAASDSEYMLNIGPDDVLQRKRIWLNYKVVENGVLLGVISTGLDFSHITEELYAQYGNARMRGFIIDSKGFICMDSARLDDEKYLFDKLEVRLEHEFSDPDIISSVNAHLKDAGEYFKAVGEPKIFQIKDEEYRFMTIAPIRFTNWSSIIMSDLPPYMTRSMLLPIFVIVLLLLIVFALATNILSRRLIFLPLDQLIESLAQIKQNSEARIYGIERHDEIGKLSSTIQDLFTKAHYDALTGIYNRRYMEHTLSDLMRMLSRSGGQLSVFMVDVDHFKFYNDTYGHDQGDVCLKAIAQTLAASVARASDFVARYGGEEFVVALPDTDEIGAVLIAQKMLENVRKLNMPHEKSSCAPYVTVSIGVTSAKVEHTHTWDDYLKCADEALYASKQNGRNKYTQREFTIKRPGMPIPRELHM